MNRNDIKRQVREELLNEGEMWNSMVHGLKSGYDMARTKFNSFVDRIMKGDTNLHKGDVYHSLMHHAGGSALAQDPAFAQKVDDVASSLGVDPDDLVRVMQKESGLNPQATNPKTNAVGLIQFMPNTCSRLGTTTEDIRNMSALEQMDYVEKYFAPFKGRLNDYEDLYMACFFPALVGKADDTVIQSRNLSAELISRQNPIIARKAGKTPGDALTVGDFKAYANAS
jgi:hypothetical protein